MDKLTCIGFKFEFDSKIASVEHEISTLTFAVEEIAKTKKLLKLFKIILEFGNFLNDGKGGLALGFKLSTLQKVTFLFKKAFSYLFFF